MKLFETFLIFVGLLSGFATNHLYATAQYGDLLIINEDTVWINANPLEIYLKEKGERTQVSRFMYGLVERICCHLENRK